MSTHADPSVDRTAGADLAAPATWSLAVKWTLAIALLLSLGMGVLGVYLIHQQERAFDRQAERLGDLLAEQLARSAAEPLLADDIFALELLLRRQLDDHLVVGAALHDLDGKRRSGVGLLPEHMSGPIDSADSQISLVGPAEAAGDRLPIRANVHSRPVRFQELLAGHVVLSLNRAPLEQDRRKLIRALIGATLGLIALLGLLAFPLARWMTAPIRRLAHGETHAGLPRSPERRLEDHSRDELGEIARRIERLSSDAAGKQQVESMLHRYLSPGVVRSVMSRPGGMALGGRALHGSVLFCDIVDFTRLSRSLSPDQVGALVNDYLGDFAQAGAWCGGTVDKFIGDCVMILFGVPELDRRHALNALVCGSAIVRLAEAINVRRRALRQPTVQFRVAINSGEMLAGNLGSRDRMEFTVVGSSVNLASRLCERTPADCLAITADTLAETGVAAEAITLAMAPMRLKGYDEPVESHLVRALGRQAQARVEDCLEAINERSLEPA